jgi:hypothetical protein
MAARRALAGASPAAASHERSECLAAGPKEPGSLSGIPYSWDSLSGIPYSWDSLSQPGRAVSTPSYDASGCVRLSSRLCPAKIRFWRVVMLSRHRCGGGA